MELPIGTCLTFLTFLSYTSLSGSSPINKISIGSLKSQSLVKSGIVLNVEIKDSVPSKVEYDIVRDNTEATNDQNKDQSSKKKRRRRRRKHRSKNSKSRTSSNKRRLSKYNSDKVDYIIIKSKNNTSDAVNKQTQEKNYSEFNETKVIIADIVLNMNPKTLRTYTTLPEITSKTLTEPASPNVMYLKAKSITTDDNVESNASTTIHTFLSTKPTLQVTTETTTPLTKTDVLTTTKSTDTFISTTPEQELTKNTSPIANTDTAETKKSINSVTLSTTPKREIERENTSDEENISTTTVTKSTNRFSSSPVPKEDQIVKVSLPTVPSVRKSLYSLITSPLPVKEVSTGSKMAVDSVGTTTVGKPTSSFTTLYTPEQVTTSKSPASRENTDTTTERKITKSTAKPIQDEQVITTETSSPFENTDGMAVEMFPNSFTKSATHKPEITASIILPFTNTDVTRTSYNKFTTMIAPEPKFITTVESTAPPTTQEVTSASVSEYIHSPVELMGTTTKQATVLSHPANVASRLKTRTGRPTSWRTHRDNEYDISDYFATFSSDENAKHSEHSDNEIDKDFDNSFESKFYSDGKRRKPKRQRTKAVKGKKQRSDDSEDDKEVNVSEELATTERNVYPTRKQHRPGLRRTNADHSRKLTHQSDDSEDNKKFNLREEVATTEDKFYSPGKQRKPELQKTNAGDRIKQRSDNFEDNEKVNISADDLATNKSDAKNDNDEDASYDDEEYDQLDIETFMSLLNMLNRENSGEVNSKKSGSGPKHTAQDNYVYDSNDNVDDVTLHSNAIHSSDGERQIINHISDETEKSTSINKRKSNDFDVEDGDSDYFDSEFEFYSDSNDEYDFDFPTKMLSNENPSSEFSTKIQDKKSNERNRIKPLSQNPNTRFFLDKYPDSDSTGDSDDDVSTKTSFNKNARDALSPEIQEEMLNDKNKKTPLSNSPNTRVLSDDHPDSDSHDDSEDNISAKTSSENQPSEFNPEIQKETLRNQNKTTPLNNIRNTRLLSDNHPESDSNDEGDNKLSTDDNPNPNFIPKKQEEGMNEQNKISFFDKSLHKRFLSENNPDSDSKLYSDSNDESVDNTPNTGTSFKENQDSKFISKVWKDKVNEQNKGMSSDNSPHGIFQSNNYPDSEYEFYYESDVSDILSRKNRRSKGNSDSESEKLQDNSDENKKGASFINNPYSGSLLDDSFEYEFYSDSDDSSVVADNGDDDNLSKKEKMDSFQHKSRSSSPTKSAITVNEHAGSIEDSDIQLPKTNVATITQESDENTLQSDEDSDTMLNAEKSKTNIIHEETKTNKNSSPEIAGHMNITVGSSNVISKIQHTSGNMHKNQRYHADSDEKGKKPKKASITESDSSSYEYYYESEEDEVPKKTLNTFIYDSQEDDNSNKAKGKTVPTKESRIKLYANSIDHSDDSWSDDMFESDEYNFKSSGESHVTSKKIVDMSDEEFGYFSDDDDDLFEYSDEYEYEYDTDENESIRSVKKNNKITKPSDTEERKDNYTNKNLKSKNRATLDKNDTNEIKSSKPK